MLSKKFLKNPKLKIISSFTINLSYRTDHKEIKTKGAEKRHALLSVHPPWMLLCLLYHHYRHLLRTLFLDKE